MRHTGIFVTPEEVEEVRKLHREAMNTPAFGLSSRQVLAGNDFASLAYRRLYARVAELARAHGLSDVAGEYGLLLKTGEILAPDREDK